jgi:putative peptidoglycan lipid II flippase
LTPALVGLICNVGIYLCMALVPPALSHRALQVTDLAIANSVQWMTHALIMLWLLRSRLGGLGGYGLGRLAIKAIIGSVAMGGGVWLAINLIVSVVGERSIAREALGVIGAAAIGLVIYVGAMLLMRVQDVRTIWRIVLRRRVA